MDGEDETALSEITILPDGRVYVFGTSGQVLEVLQTLETRDARLEALRTELRQLEQEAGRKPEKCPACQRSYDGRRDVGRVSRETGSHPPYCAHCGQALA